MEEVENLIQSDAENEVIVEEESKPKKNPKEKEKEKDEKKKTVGSVMVFDINMTYIIIIVPIVKKHGQ